MTHRSAHTEFRIVSMLVTVYGYITYSIPSHLSAEPDDVRREHELAVPVAIVIALGACAIPSLGWLLQVLVVRLDRLKRTKAMLFDRKRVGIGTIAGIDGLLGLIRKVAIEPRHFRARF
jgi:hypothetical protein